jgi:hypothetical protein
MSGRLTLVVCDGPLAVFQTCASIQDLYRTAFFKPATKVVRANLLHFSEGKPPQGKKFHIASSPGESQA